MAPPSPSSLEWSNDTILTFLELYEMERCLWDPTHKEHKLRHKIHDAWTRISSSMGNIPVEVLKAKKKSLMATFRPLLKKKKDSIRSGAGADEVFQPIWFGFDQMERFLAPLYDVSQTIDTEHGDLPSDNASMQSQYIETASPSLPGPSTSQLGPPSQPGASSSQPSPSSQPGASSLQPVSSSSRTVPSPSPLYTRPNKGKKRGTIDETQAQINISQSLDTLNQMLKEKVNKQKENDEDECDIYGKLIAKKIRKYPESMRAHIMYQIDGLLLENQVEIPSNAIHHVQHTRNSFSSQSQYSDHQYQTSTPSPLHVIPQPQQSPQPIYIMQPRVSESPVQLSIPEANVTQNTNMSSQPQQSSQPIYIMQPRVSESPVQLNYPEVNDTPETNLSVAPRNKINLIEKAYFNATHM